MSGSYPSPTFDALTLNSALPVASGGTGATTVAGIAGAISATFYVATIAALRALTSATTATTASVSGYATAADGGGGTFVVNANDTTSTDNGGTIIVDAAGRRWYRLWDGANTSIRAWGAKVDGTTDDSAAIQAAINFLQSGTANQGGNGGVIRLPAGTVLINSGITVSTGGITLQGAGWEEYLGYQGQYTPGEPGTHGTIINTTSTSASPITLASDAANNAAVRDMMFMQTQPADASGWTPTIYPPTINITGSGAQPGGAKLLENLFSWNSYEFIRIGSVGNPAARVDMRRIWGMPLQYGINAIFSSDVNRFDDIHFWQFDANVPNIIAWIQANGVGFRITRSDNFIMSRCFCYGYEQFAQFTSSTDGATQNFSISDCGADSCWYGILVNASSGTVTGKVSNFYHQSDTGTPNPGNGGGFLNAGSATSSIDFANVSSNLAMTSGVDAGGADWAFANIRVTNYNQLAGGYNGITSNSGGTVTLSGRVLISGGGSGPTTGGTGTIINWSGTSTTNATASRALGSSYTNSTGKPMTVNVSVNASSTGVGNLVGLVAGNGVVLTSIPNSDYGNVTFVVPNGDSYEVTFSGTGTLNTWQETY